MNTYLRALLATICTIALLQSPLLATEPTLPTVTQVDLERYAGRWYEISRLPMWFERKCTGNITATYTPREDKRI
ncbi:MAG: lipocalin family protein, partial [Fluviibacter sp.]